MISTASKLAINSAVLGSFEGLVWLVTFSVLVWELQKFQCLQMTFRGKTTLIKVNKVIKNSQVSVLEKSHSLNSFCHKFYLPCLALIVMIMWHINHKWLCITTFSDTQTVDNAMLWSIFDNLSANDSTSGSQKWLKEQWAKGPHMQENNEVDNKVIPRLPLLCLPLGTRLMLRLVFTSNMHRRSKALL